MIEESIIKGIAKDNCNIKIRSYIDSDSWYPYDKANTVSSNIIELAIVDDNENEKGKLVMDNMEAVMLIKEIVKHINFIED